MKKNKNVIPEDPIAELNKALSNFHNAERHINKVSINADSILEPLAEAKRNLIRVIFELSQK